MSRKGKSLNELRFQADRLYNNPRAGTKRRERIQSALDRYLLNIMDSKTYEQDLKNYHDAPSFAESRKLDYKMENRKYSQRQYMGLSTG